MLPPHLPHDSPSGPYHTLDPPSSSAPHHPFQLQGMELPGMSASQDGAALLSQDGGTFSPNGGPMTSTLSVVSGWILITQVIATLLWWRDRWKQQSGDCYNNVAWVLYVAFPLNHEVTHTPMLSSVIIHKMVHVRCNNTNNCYSKSFFQQLADSFEKWMIHYFPPRLGKHPKRCGNFKTVDA